MTHYCKLKASYVPVFIGAFFWAAMHTPAPVSASIIQAKSGSPADLRTAAASAQEGDTLLIPAGTFIFNEIVTVSKGIYLMGSGNDKTTLRRTAGTTPFSSGMIHFECSGNQRVEVSDIHLQGYRLSSDSKSEPHSGLALSGCTNFKIHDCIFEDFVQAGLNIHNAVLSSGVVYGNRFLNNFMTSAGEGPRYGYGVQVSDNNDTTLWARPIESLLGMANTVFIEDNFFQGNKHGITGGGGSYYVARHNTFIADGCTDCQHQVDMHGPFSANSVGGRGYEIYNNTISRNNVHICPRGGDGVIFSNTFLGFDHYNIALNIENEAAHCSNGYPCKNQITDLYIWGNNPQGPQIIKNNYPQYIVENRDYYLKSRPGYVSCAYPHPLRNTTPLFPSDSNLCNAASFLSADTGIKSTHPASGLWDGNVTGESGNSTGGDNLDSFKIVWDLSKLGKGPNYSLAKIRLFGDSAGTWVSKRWRVETALANGNYFAIIEGGCFGNQWFEKTGNWSARYVRLTVFGDTAKHAVQAREFEVYGSPASTGIAFGPKSLANSARETPAAQTLSLYDIHGKLVRTWNSARNIQLDNDIKKLQLPNGLYLLVSPNWESLQSKRMIVINRE